MSDEDDNSGNGWGVFVVVVWAVEGKQESDLTTASGLEGLTVFGISIAAEQFAVSVRSRLGWVDISTMLEEAVNIYVKFLQLQIKTFLEVHKQKKPKTIFTDQDPAMAKALAEVLLDTFHGLCSWHIMQNGIKHLGYLMKDGSFFLTDFATCMYEHEEEKEFEDAWNAMLCKYNVCSNPWLEKIYEIKEKWAKCYMKEFERVANEKHYKELEAEYNSRQKLSRVKVQKSPVLQQAAKIYTPSIFEKYFQEEFDWSSAAIIKQREESTHTHEYTIAIVDEKREHKEHKSFGILCCHSLKVLDVWDIKRIPDQYILKRWTREARNEAVASMNEAKVMEDKKLTIAERYRTACPILVDIASRASGDEKAFELVGMRGWFKKVKLKAYFRRQKGQQVEPSKKKNEKSSDKDQSVPQQSQVN
ncbi:protein FAR1-RELATED SEQUENCE 4-like [Rosa chinensis]|uniref:protein FAR1-RELATED SEQUENCE 4-like n=1 Tax=Rosa chinensis TaxID=74649 RepID=UPI000D095574|nr:protein FAR1-RELATED SEQUENCE 4-like [Rosa chinensis]